MTLTRVTPLAGETILPLAEVKASAHITHNGDDAILAGFRDAALGEIERRSGVALATAQFTWTLRAFPSRIDLPMRPVTAVDEVTYSDADGLVQTYLSARLIDGRVLPAASGSWPSAYDNVKVTFTAGPPASDQLAILIAAAHVQFQILENRGRDDMKFIEGMEKAVESLLGTIWRVMV